MSLLTSDVVSAINLGITTNAGIVPGHGDTSGFVIGGVAPNTSTNTFSVQRQATYSGGDLRSTVGAIWADTFIGPNVGSYEYGTVSYMYNTSTSTSAQMTAMSALLTRTANCDSWGFQCVASDVTTVANKGQLTSQEIDLYANGPDIYNTRRGIFLVAGNANALTNGGAVTQPMTAFAAIDIISSGMTSGVAADAVWNNGIVIEAVSQVGILNTSTHFSNSIGIKHTGSYKNSIDLSGATHSGPAIVLKGGDSISMEATQCINIRWNQSKGYIEFWNDNSGKRHGYIDMFNGADHAF